jgi:hypothetical protein
LFASDTSNHFHNLIIEQGYTTPNFVLEMSWVRIFSEIGYFTSRSFIPPSKE